jgi:hypothetical protein
MKLVPMIADGLNLMSFNAATPYLKIRASFARTVPLLEMIMSQNIERILQHVQISLGMPQISKLGPMRVDCMT